jgi:hypothetical protein
MCQPPESGRVGLRIDVKRHGSGREEHEPHGREWLKQATGFGEAQAAMVVGNGGGGPKRVWKPATRWRERGRASGGERVAGKWIPRTGSAEGATNPTGGWT